MKDTQLDDKKAKMGKKKFYNKMLIKNNHNFCKIVCIKRVSELKELLIYVTNFAELIKNENRNNCKEVKK